MKTINALTIALIIMLGVSYQLANAQTWKPVYDYDKSIAGFEDAEGNRKDMKYEYTTLVDEANPMYSVVSIKKAGTEDLLYGIVDNNTLKPVIPIKYNNITVYKRIVIIDQEVAIGDDTKKITEIYNSNLKKIYPQQLENVYPDSKNNYIAFENADGKKGVIDAEGKVVIPFNYGSIQIFDDNLFEVKNSIFGPATIINNLNKIIISEKANYDYYSYNKGFFVVYLTNESSKQAFVNSSGDIVFKAEPKESLHWSKERIGAEYDYVHAYDSKNFQKLYDLKGKNVLPSSYYSVSILNSDLVDFNEGDFDNPKRGVYNIKTQKQIISSEYKYIYMNAENKQIKAQKADNSIVYYDLNGKVIKK